ncbi:hypothetical protein SUGI_0252850 [Cryptomeria japonica]|nr:hypothetical protein SUGI_0252850 [Cryptomeria japonica]
MYKTAQFLDLIRKNVKGWNRFAFGNIFAKKKEINASLVIIPERMEHGDFSESTHRTKEELIEKWKENLKQKSRIQWLRQGDINSAFFHRSKSKNRSKNMILSLRDESNQEIKDDTQLGITASNYFCNTFREESTTNNFLLDGQLLHCLPTTLDEVDNALIMAPTTNEEVRSDSFSMGPYKALGPEGFPMTFFREF